MKIYDEAAGEGGLRKTIGGWGWGVHEKYCLSKNFDQSPHCPIINVMSLMIQCLRPLDFFNLMLLV